MIGERRCDMPKSKRKKYFQDPLFDQFRGDTCYVCCRKIPAHKGVCVGQGLWRHLTCKPGSRSWSWSDVEGRLARNCREKPGEGT
jgi:hypothetical protein